MIVHISPRPGRRASGTSGRPAPPVQELGLDQDSARPAACLAPGHFQAISPKQPLLDDGNADPEPPIPPQKYT